MRFHMWATERLAGASVAYTSDAHRNDTCSGDLRICDWRCLLPELRIATVSCILRNVLVAIGLLHGLMAQHTRKGGMACCPGKMVRWNSSWRASSRASMK